MTITINNKEITLKYSFRALMIYEKITNHSFVPQSLTDVVVFMYCIITASNPDANISWDDFMDHIDNNPETFNEFAEWLNQTNSRNNLLNSNDKKEEIENTEVDPKKE